MKRRRSRMCGMYEAGKEESAHMHSRRNQGRKGGKEEE
jgi:hypothetical protein